MEYRENPIYGRKVFFINPPISVEHYIVNSLRNNEYEAYVITDYRCAKSVLAQNENAMCFIFIDDVLTLSKWFNFIKSFEYDSSLSSIFLGVLSVKLRTIVQQKFLMNLKIPGGFVMLNQKVEDIYKRLEAILDLNGAKGNRRYIRIDCDKGKFEGTKIDGYLSQNGMLYSFNAINLSTSGFTCETPENLSFLFPVGNVINDVRITVGRRSVVSQVYVVNSKIKNGRCISVLLFTKDNPPAVKKYVRDYIQFQFADSMREEIENSIKDLTDYSDRGFYDWVLSSFGNTEGLITLDTAQAGDGLRKSVAEVGEEEVLEEINEEGEVTEDVLLEELEETEASEKDDTDSEKLKTEENKIDDTEEKDISENKQMDEMSDTGVASEEKTTGVESED